MNLPVVMKTVIFTDVRNILCGDPRWFSLNGKTLPLYGMPEPPVEVRANAGFLPKGIRLVAQQARKTEPLTTPPPGRVIFENGIYRSWGIAVEYPKNKDFGTSSDAQPVSVVIRYAESRDGFEWQEKGRCPIDVQGQTAFDGFTVFIDSKGKAEERYKAVYSASPPKSEWQVLQEKYEKVHPRHKDLRLGKGKDKLYCMYSAVSPDGIHWKPISEPLLVHMSDTDTTIYYDSWLDRYVMYTRLYWQDRRWVGRAETCDFYHWGPVEPLLWPDLDGPFSDDIYTNCRTTYPNLPEYHLMFPMIYHRYNQTSEVRMYSSADGICWMKVPGGAVVSPGETGEWDSKFISAGNDLVPLGTDRIGLRYYGTSYPHKYPRWKKVLEAMKTAWVWWEKGRISAIMADEEGEFFTFPPMVPAGRELKINVRTKIAGEIRVGLTEGFPILADIHGRTITDCDPIIGDNLSAPVHWNGKTDIGVKMGQHITLHFKLHSAELFGFEWR